MVTPSYLGWIQVRQSLTKALAVSELTAMLLDVIVGQAVGRVDDLLDVVANRLLPLPSRGPSSQSSTITSRRWATYVKDIVNMTYGLLDEHIQHIAVSSPDRVVTLLSRRELPE